MDLGDRLQNPAQLMFFGPSMRYALHWKPYEPLHLDPARLLTLKVLPSNCMLAPPGGPPSSCTVH